MLVLDTSVLVDSLTGPKRSASALRRAIEAGERILVPTVVLYEWLRGPRSPEEIASQEALFPADLAIPFGPVEAAMGARIFRELRRPHGREIDIGIAACAIGHDAALWTLNFQDFQDIPKLRLYHE